MVGPRRAPTRLLPLNTRRAHHPPPPHPPSSGNAFVCLQSAAGAFLSADAAATSSSHHAACAAQHVFEVIDLDGYGTVALRSTDGSSYLQAAAGGAVRMAEAESSGAVGLRQTFLIDEVHT